MKRSIRKQSKQNNTNKKRKRQVTPQVFDETEYFIDAQGYRRVWPYLYNFENYVKGRWVGRRILNVFQEEFGSHSNEYFADAISAGSITVNQQVVSPDHVIKDGDHIIHRTLRFEPPSLAWDLEVVPLDQIHQDTMDTNHNNDIETIHETEATHDDTNCLVEAKPEKTNQSQNVVHANDKSNKMNPPNSDQSKLFQHSLIALNKPPSIPVHPCGPYRYNSLIVYASKCLNIPYSSLHVIHRLDRHTSGLVLLARDPKTALKFSQLLKESRVQKFYLARVNGKFPTKSMEINKELTETAQTSGSDRPKSHQIDQGNVTHLLVSGSNAEDTKARQKGEAAVNYLRTAFIQKYKHCNDEYTTQMASTTSESCYQPKWSCIDAPVGPISRMNAMYGTVRNGKPSQTRIRRIAVIRNGKLCLDNDILQATGSSRQSPNLQHTQQTPVKQATQDDMQTQSEGVATQTQSEEATIQTQSEGVATQKQSEEVTIQKQSEEATIQKQSEEDAIQNLSVETTEEISDESIQSIVLCQPLSGRTHQIRVHLQSIGHPICNDPLYASTDGIKDKKTASLIRPPQTLCPASIPKDDPSLLLIEQGGWNVDLIEKPEIERRDLIIAGICLAHRYGLPKLAQAIHSTHNLPASFRFLADYVSDTVSYLKMPVEELAFGDECEFKTEQIHSMGLWLHSWRYQSDDWAYQTSIPSWACP